MLNVTTRSGPTGAARARARWLPSNDAGPDAKDAGSLIAVLILVLALAALAFITLTAVLPTSYVGTSSQNGQQAVAQANAGLSDALLQLDQMGDQVSSFCVGDAPSSLLSAAGLTSCANQTTSPPVAGAPGVTYYFAKASTSSLNFGVTNEVNLTSSATVDGQTRVATEIVYREANTFGLFGVGTITFEGQSTGTFFAGSGNPLALTSGVTVKVGAGPNGSATCNGGSAGSVWIGEKGAVVTCSGSVTENTTFEPSAPSFCGTGQVSTVFTPCINTGGSSLDSCPNCATVNGQTYCPLPGLGFKTQPTVPSAPTPAQNAVFDCTSSTSGGSVTIGDYQSAGSCASTSGSSPTVSMPDDFTSIPPGNYYLDSNNVTICGIPPSALPTGPVNIFIMPAACGSGSNSGQCPYDLPSSSDYTCPVGGSSWPPWPQLTVNGYINVTTPPSGYTGPTVTAAKGAVIEAGSPNDFNLFWGGNSALNWSKGIVLDSNFYAPGAAVTTNGSDYTLIGSTTVNCMKVSGSPTFDFIYGQHPTQYLQGWTVTKYSINP